MAVDERALPPRDGRRRGGRRQVAADRRVRRVGSADDATVLRGRCLPYGDGITFWPLAEVVRRRGADRASDDTPEAALREARRRSPSDAERRRRASRRRSGSRRRDVPGRGALLGRAASSSRRSAAEQPLVVVFDDIHWAEPTFLELHRAPRRATRGRADSSSSARPGHELLERSPDWSTEPARDRIALEPLARGRGGGRSSSTCSATAELDAETSATRIVAAAEGNPLFVEQLLSMLIDDGAHRLRRTALARRRTIGDVAVPPTIQALLAARLDRLAREERAVIEPASVIGRVFVQRRGRGARARSASGPTSAAHLGDARPTSSSSSPTARGRRRGRLPLPPHPHPRRRLPGHPQARAGDAPRALRRVGRRASTASGGDRVRGDPRLPPRAGSSLPLRARPARRPRARALGADAARRLASAGRRAFARGDMPAAANLLGARRTPAGRRRGGSGSTPDPDAALDGGSASSSEAEAVLEQAIGRRGRRRRQSSGVGRAASARELVRLQLEPEEHGGRACRTRSQRRSRLRASRRRRRPRAEPGACSAGRTARCRWPARAEPRSSRRSCTRDAPATSGRRAEIRGSLAVAALVRADADRQAIDPLPGDAGAGRGSPTREGRSSACSASLHAMAGDSTRRATSTVAAARSSRSSVFDVEAALVAIEGVAGRDARVRPGSRGSASSAGRYDPAAVGRSSPALDGVGLLGQMSTRSAAWRRPTASGSRSEGARDGRTMSTRRRSGVASEGAAQTPGTGGGGRKGSCARRSTSSSRRTPSCSRSDALLDLPTCSGSAGREHEAKATLRTASPVAEPSAAR